MIKINKTIGFIGAGNMAEAISGALAKSGIIDPSMMTACDTDRNRLDYMQQAYQLNTTENIHSLFDTNDVIILAVKPQSMDDVLAAIIQNSTGTLTTRKLIISIAAGIKLSKFEERLYPAFKDSSSKNLPIVRVMPNTPSLVLEGMAGICANRNATSDDIATARTIMESMGRVIEVGEEKMDAVTAMSGSGPAYFFYFIESMVEAGEDMGLTPEESLELAVATMKGAAKLLGTGTDSPETLRRKVTSPGGTTAAAIQVFEETGTKEIIKKALNAASSRSKELSG